VFSQHCACSFADFLNRSVAKTVRDGRRARAFISILIADVVEDNLFRKEYPLRTFRCSAVPPANKNLERMLGIGVPAAGVVFAALFTAVLGLRNAAGLVTRGSAGSESALA